MTIPKMATTAISPRSRTPTTSPSAATSKIMKYDVIIIGGGAGGLSAARYASKKGAKPQIVEGAPPIGRKKQA
ncbi:MAG: FAD-dependent oxidoreductase, partial [Clostridia bacterium]|nr:FAD-dependent oxidoreductase [Clostridia bacterium]